MTATHVLRRAARALFISTTIVSAFASAQSAAGDLTSNEKAANGPIPGDVGLYAKELACQQQVPTPGYYSSINGAENADAQRSGLFPCATFTGTWTGPNQVYAWRSEDGYEATTYINNRKPGELFILGGEVPPADSPIPPGPYLAKADAASGRQIWRTYLDNGNVDSGVWIANANLNILPDGNIIVAWSTNIVLIDADTGLILQHNSLPSGPTTPTETNYKHVTIAPDGTLILKSQTRPAGCALQGTVAIIQCSQQGMKLGNSNMLAVDPKTLEVIDSIALPEPTPAPHIIDMLGDRIAIYIPASVKVYRYFWDPKARKLSKDDAWDVTPTVKGQVAMAAPAVIGDWVIIQTNGLVSKEKASSIVAVNKQDPAKMTSVFPFGELTPGEMSWAPPKPETDPENGMVYSADVGMGQVAGIRIDQATGALNVAFVLDDMTTTFQPMIGPKDKRVLLLTNMKKDIGLLPNMVATMKGAYREQMTWRNAATGEILAQSDFFEPLTINSLPTPGFGGRLYFPTGKGFIIMQVKPASR